MHTHPERGQGRIPGQQRPDYSWQDGDHRHRQIGGRSRARQPAGARCPRGPRCAGGCRHGRDAIDGVLACSAFASPFHRFSVAFSEYFGIQPTFSNTLQVSGATAATLFNVAAAAIAGGLAARAHRRRRQPADRADADLALRSMTESRDQQYEMPFGIPVANTFAMTAHPPHEGIRHDGRAARQGGGHPARARTPHARRADDGADHRRRRAELRLGDDAVSQARLLTDLRRRCRVRRHFGGQSEGEFVGREAGLHPRRRRVLHARAHLLMPSLTTTGAVQSSAQGLCDGRMHAAPTSTSPASTTVSPAPSS